VLHSNAGLKKTGKTFVQAKPVGVKRVKNVALHIVGLASV
jgi:hypothetical protein